MTTAAVVADAVNVTEQSEVADPVAVSAQAAVLPPPANDPEPSGAVNVTVPLGGAVATGSVLLSSTVAVHTVALPLVTSSGTHEPATVVGS